MLLGGGGTFQSLYKPEANISLVVFLRFQSLSSHWKHEVTCCLISKLPSSWGWGWGVSVVLLMRRNTAAMEKKHSSCRNPAAVHTALWG